MAMLRTLLDENGRVITLSEPHYDARFRRWFGEKPPRRNPDNPPCTICGTNELVEIWMYGHVDSDGLYHYPVYRCRRCGREF